MQVHSLFLFIDSLLERFNMLATNLSFLLIRDIVNSLWFLLFVFAFFRKMDVGIIFLLPVRSFG